MKEFQEIREIRNRLKIYLDTAPEIDAETGAPGPLKLMRERLAKLPLNNAALMLLKRHASPTLTQEFKKTKTDNNTINSEKLIKNIVSAMREPLRKSFFTISLIAGLNPDEETIAALDREEKESLIQSGYSLLHSMSDIAANITLMLPEKSDPPDACDKMVRDFTDNMIPVLKKDVPILALKMGFELPEIIALEEKARAELHIGREHLNAINPEAWQKALNPA